MMSNITTKEYRISKKEEQILRELIRNPRCTDKFISTETKIPLKTVNRTRKKLEESNMIMYSAKVNNFENGTQRFSATDQFILTFKLGITRNAVLTAISSKKFISNKIVVKHVTDDFVGEKDGRAIYGAIIVSRAISDMVEIINAEIIPLLEHLIKPECIEKIEEIHIHKRNKICHNYYPDINMKNGRINSEFSNENIFISE